VAEKGRMIRPGPHGLYRQYGLPPLLLSCHDFGEDCVRAVPQRHIGSSLARRSVLILVKANMTFV
jgi:hypothetical protein